DPGVCSALPPCHRQQQPRQEREGAAGSRGTVPQRGVFCSRPYQSDPSFHPELVVSKSTAAAGLCSWCLNIVRFYEVFCQVEPKRRALED
ncbi:DYH17 protein, partial [Corythaeola cristata]|nr:DYH17 protein [Corythaeola cristata]